MSNAHVATSRKASGSKLMPLQMPMKIIKVGSSAQSRVAQACDRCRSKKIRCDGITPCCTQCATVGFECKTSDKLSRRAFPRGYTESLEERVRQLESEVRDLKNLLDEKDEKIDLLSKFHDFSANRRRTEPSMAPSTTRSVSQQTPAVVGTATTVPESTDDTFAIKQPNSLTKTSNRNEPHWAGASSSTSFLDVFKEKAATSGRAVPPVSPRALFPSKGLLNRRPAGGHARRPPRLVSDRLVNVFFQEFAPLFPILCRPVFFQQYQEFSDGSDNIENHHAVAQLNLVFSIATTACDVGKEHAPAFDNHWQSALNSVVHDNSLATLQCLVLAQLCCLCKGDSNRVLHYAGIAIIMSRRLGLHKLQASLGLDALTTELRKRTFWCLYTLDTFTAAYLGLPRLIKDEVVQTETPIDVDDEDLCEQRTTASAPETKMSASLALSALARIFARVIDNIYQAPSASGISVQTVAAISDSLDAWRDALAPHLRLTFVQDKPSTRVTGDRSPLLSLAYYHIRALLHRPLATSDLGSKAVPSAMTLADSSKHIVQIVQLLDERRMGFTLPMSRNEVLVAAGLGLLFQGLTMIGNSGDSSPGAGSSIVSENQRLVCGIMSILDTSNAPCAAEFKSLACALITVEGFRVRRTPSGSQANSISPRSSISQVRPAHNSADNLATAAINSQSPTPRRQSLEGDTSSSGLKAQHATIAQRRAIASPGKVQFPDTSAIHLNQCRGQHQHQRQHQHQYQHQHYQNNFYKHGLTPMKSEPQLRASGQSQPHYQGRHQQPHQHNAADPRRVSIMLATGQLPNLDYLPLGSDASPVSSLTPVAQRPNTFDSSSQWDHILGCLSGPVAISDSSIGASPPVDLFSPAHSVFDGNVGVTGLGGLDWTGGADPNSATAWTDSTGVPSVFDDSGASLTSGEDGRSSSIDLGKKGPNELGKEIDYLSGTSGVNLTAGLTDDFASLQGLEVGLQI